MNKCKTKKKKRATTTRHNPLSTFSIKCSEADQDSLEEVHSHRVFCCPQSNKVATKLPETMEKIFMSINEKSKKKKLI